MTSSQGSNWPVPPSAPLRGGVLLSARRNHACAICSRTRRASGLCKAVAISKHSVALRRYSSTLPMTMGAPDC
jgi:hypothetical protein